MQKWWSPSLIREAFYAARRSSTDVSETPGASLALTESSLSLNFLGVPNLLFDFPLESGFSSVFIEIATLNRSPAKLFEANMISGILNPYWHSQLYSRFATFIEARLRRRTAKMVTFCSNQCNLARGSSWRPSQKEFLRNSFRERVLRFVHLNILQNVHTQKCSQLLNFGVWTCLDFTKLQNGQTLSKFTERKNLKFKRLSGCGELLFGKKFLLSFLAS